VRKLRYSLDVDLPLTLGSLFLWTTSELAKNQLSPSHCHWCRTNGFDDGAREALRWHNHGAAQTASNLLAFGVIPLGLAAGMAVAATHDHALRSIGVDIAIITEAAALGALANQAVKFSAARARPFVSHPSAQSAELAHGADANLSFYSGHTSLAFSLVVAAGVTATLRKYRAAPYIWAIGLPLAVLTGYLRIAADRHYLSDVCTGAVLGSAAGALTPLLLHYPLD
jgi:membrane-associated phospholipid phosphatase